MDEKTIDALTLFQKEFEPIMDYVTPKDFLPQNLQNGHCGHLVPKIASWVTNGNCIPCYFEKKYGIVFPMNDGAPDLQMHIEVKARGTVIYNSKIAANALTKHIHTKNPYAEDETEMPFKLAKKAERFSSLTSIIRPIKH